MNSKYIPGRGFILLALLLMAGGAARAVNLAIDSLSGPVTQNEVNTFISYMQSQSPPPTPWGPLNGTGHNDWADGYGGRDLEAMGEMFIVSSNMTILNLMISWSDNCTSQRNDLMSATNGGQRVMWTGLIDKIWCPNWPTDMTSNQYLYCGCETEDLIGHLAFCAKLILQNPAIWNLTVPDGNPYGYGTTYFQRATNYLGKCDEANDEYFLKWFIQPGTSLIVPPTNSAWTALNENVTANNRQMMFTSGFQRLAEAHQILGDNPARVTQYDAIVKASTTQCLTGMTNFHPYTVNGQRVYNWGYYPTSTSGSEATEIHAEYDIIGLWRAFSRTNYGFTLAPLVPFANTMNEVIYLGTNNFSVNVDGSGGIQSPVYSGWILPADWNPQVYTTVAGSAYTNGWFKGSADIAAGILFMKNRRYLEFSVTPAPGSAVVPAGSGANFNVAVAPLGGFTNTVNLSVTGLPSGAGASFTAAAINTGALNFASTNVTLTISTTAATPTGTYPLNVIGTSGSVSHTNIVKLVVGTVAVAASPAMQTVPAGTGTSFTVGVTTNSGFSGTVTFGVSGLPANTTAGFSPGSLNGTGYSTLTLNTGGNTPVGTYSLTITGTNGTVVAGTNVTVTVLAGSPVWNGGSSVDNNWSDATNWSGIALTPDAPLVFNNSTRLNNTNDTGVNTIYSNIIFSAGAGLFSLNGNAVMAGGNITNDSVNTETVNFPLGFTNSVTFNGANGMLVIGGGLTNRTGAPGFTTLTLAGTGELVNRLGNTASPGGTNVILLDDPAAEWTLVDNANATAMTVPWNFEVFDGTFNFGTATSAPTLTGTTPNNVPSDNVIGDVAGDTATFNMINGTLTTAGRFDTAVAGGATGVINQSGGTMNIGSQFQGANGSNPGEVSVVSVTGGTMNIQAGGPFYVASRGTGSLTVGGPGMVSCGRLDISRNAAGNSVSSAGTVELDGGVLTVQSVTNVSANAQTGGNPTAAFNFNGGTLKAAPGAAALFFQGSVVTPVTPIVTTVMVGGAVIDDGGNVITIAEPLQHDASLGTDMDGGLTKFDTGTLTLTATNTYNGDTLVSAGTLALGGSGSISNSDNITVNAGAILDVSGHTGGALTVAAGQTLTGDGMVKGNFVIGNGATLAPGTGIGTLTFNNDLALNGGSTTVMGINKSTVPSNDLAQVTGTLTYGGTLVISNLGTNNFSVGDSFKLFSAATFAGSFTNIQPVIPDINLAWSTNNLNGGILKVVSAPTPPPRVNRLGITGNNLVFSGTNGVPNWTYCVVTSTNVGVPLSQWVPVATNAFDAAGNFYFTNGIDPTAAQMYFEIEMQ